MEARPCLSPFCRRFPNCNESVILRLWGPFVIGFNRLYSSCRKKLLILFPPSQFRCFAPKSIVIKRKLIPRTASSTLRAWTVCATKLRALPAAAYGGGGACRRSRAPPRHRAQRGPRLHRPACRWSILPPCCAASLSHRSLSHFPGPAHCAHYLPRREQLGQDQGLLCAG